MVRNPRERGPNGTNDALGERWSWALPLAGATGYVHLIFLFSENGLMYPRVCTAEVNVRLGGRRSVPNRERAKEG